MKKYYIYILTNLMKTVVYVGVTDNLQRRLREHQLGTHDGFTKKYNVNILVYYEIYNKPKIAIMREKQLKDWRREKKDELINTQNPEWEDLSKKEGFNLV